MQRGFLLLIIGMALIITGAAIIASSVSIVEEKFQLTGIVMESETISPSESQTVSATLFSDDELFFGIGTFPRDVPMVVQIKDQDGLTLFEMPFEGEHIESLGKIEPGDYYFSVLNLGTVPVTVNAIVTADPILDEIEMLGNIAIAMLAGFFLLLVGFIIIIIGAIVWFLDRRKRKLRYNSKSDNRS